METIKKVISAVTGEDVKIADIKKDTVHDVHSGNYITTNFGTRISHTDDSLKAGPRGPTLMDDFHFREKIMHFDHERIPERVVHARGSGAHGYFKLYESLAEYTKAHFLCDTSKTTPVFVRFSTVLGSKGAADTTRDVRGFATKFYTDQGNFDIVGNNFPVFFIQDAIKFADIIHAGKPEPHNEIPQGASAHDNFWDFVSLTTESAHMTMWALSDRAIPRSYRMMQGFGVNTFVFVNDKGKRCFVKFHWIPLLGTHSLVWDESQKMMGIDPDFHRRDLWEAIEAGSYPEYELGVQIVQEEDEHKFDFDLLDATKIIPEELVPVKRIGKMVLNRNPENFFAETEQVAFHTGHLVPGIEASNDPLLQGRMFSYLDTQLSRLGGPNFEEIPINRPICPVINNQRDGMHRMKVNAGRVNYFPNRFGCPGVDKIRGFVHSPTRVEGEKVRMRGPKFSDHYSQARLFYNSMSPWEKQHIIDAAKFELGKCTEMAVRERTVDVLCTIDYDMGKKVAKFLGVKKLPPQDSPKLQKHDRKSPALSQENTVKNTIATRKIAILIAEGHKGAQVAALKSLLEMHGGVPVIIGPYSGLIPGEAGADTESQETFLTTKSILFDGVVLVGGKTNREQLKNTGNVIAFILEAFKHGKPIIAIDEGVDLLRELDFPDITLATDNQPVSQHGVVTVRNFGESLGSMKMERLAGFGKEVFDSIAHHRHFLRTTHSIPA